MKLKEWLSSLLTTATPNVDECIKYLGDSFPLLLKYKDTPQDKIWHAEGDVHIHTDMVLQETYKLLDSEASHIRGAERRVLILAVLFHDYAKPLTTCEKEREGLMRTVASKHEAIGRNILTTELLALELPTDEYQLILNLVGEHHIPKLLVIRNQSFNDYLRLSHQVSNLELIYFLEIADMKGRICDDLDMQLMYLEEFKTKCIQYKLWDNSFHKDLFENLWWNAKVSEPDLIYNIGNYLLMNSLISVKEEIVPATYKYNDIHSTVIIACGISGSGKTTYLKDFKPNYKIISLDQIRKELNGSEEDQDSEGQVRQIAKERFKEHLRKREDVIWDATNIRKDFRSAIVQLAHSYHAHTRIFVFLGSEQKLKQNNNKRTRQVDESIIDKQIQRFEYPTKDEAHNVLFVEKYL